jgi:hypothetical protein
MFLPKGKSRFKRRISKEALIVGAESVFDGFSNKREISALNDLKLSAVRLKGGFKIFLATFKER